MRRDHLSRAQARRIALAAQGFGRPRPDRPVTMRDVQATINRLGQFQIDSINVVTRAHFMPLFSRLGATTPACSSGPRTGRRAGCSSTGAMPRA